LPQINEAIFDRGGMFISLRPAQSVVKPHQMARATACPVQGVGRSSLLEVRSMFQVPEQRLDHSSTSVGNNTWFNVESVVAGVRLVNGCPHHRLKDRVWNSPKNRARERDE
jgi:hypothetical protein